MSKLIVLNHQVEAEMEYSSGAYPMPKVAASFGAIVAHVIDHCVSDPIKGVLWDLVGDTYLFTITMADDRVWSQTVRLTPTGSWMTFDIPDEFSSAMLKERVSLRNELASASLKYGMTNFELTCLGGTP